MSTTTRKQREIEARERLILDTAGAMLAERGYLGLNMDRIAAAIEYSKGTIYQHFSSKEDLIAGLCTDTLGKRADMFARAGAFQGRPRERMSAIAVANDVFLALYPRHRAVEHILEIGSVFGKISSDRLNAFLGTKKRMMSGLTGIVTDAVEAGELVLPAGMSPAAPVYGLWTQAVGHESLRAHAQLPPFEGIDLRSVLWHNYQLLLDGYGWRPLLHEWDYAESVRRIHAEVFPEETAILQSQALAGSATRV